MKSTIQRYFPKVTKVVDAKVPIQIEVTKQHESAGKRRNHETCALAVACEKRFKLDGVLIGRTVAYLVKGKKATRFALPPSVGREITAFDRGAGFDPGVYQLSKPEKITSGGHSRINPGNGKPRKFRHFTQNIRTTIGGKNVD